VFGQRETVLAEEELADQAPLEAVEDDGNDDRQSVGSDVDFFY
jgi:hypothetical protein